LVHRRIRYVRPQAGQGAARRADVVSNPARFYRGTGSSRPLRY
jgi:hypothetical protein